jgi:hypothetical protein
MKVEKKLVCTYCKSDDLTYLPDVFGQSWVRHYYKQKKDGNWSLVALGSTPDKNDDSVNVNDIDRNIINWNDSRPFFSCESCTAELDGYSDVDYKTIKKPQQLEFNFS